MSSLNLFSVSSLVLGATDQNVPGRGSHTRDLQRADPDQDEPIGKGPNGKRATWSWLAISVASTEIPMSRIGFVAFFAVGLAFISIGCDDSTEPAGSVSVTTSTAGDTLDPDGYALLFDERDGGRIGINDTRTLGLAPGTHALELVGLAVNCALVGDNPREVQVTADQPVEVRFEVVCQAAPFDGIAFSSGDRIWVVAPDGSNPVAVTTPDERSVDEYPAWSPDGTRIAFTRYARASDGRITDPKDVHVLDIASSEVTRLTDDADVELSAWAPDGESIAFSSFAFSSGDIFVMNADGTDPVNLMPDSEGGFDPAWSPDGNRIAFARDFEIWVMDADGSDPIQLTQVSEPPAVAYEPAWSPDGSRIAFTFDASADSGFISVMDADGSNLTRLIGNQFFAGRPSWSPDGSRIAYYGSGVGGLKIFVAGSDGSNPVSIAEGSYPAWAPSP